MNGIPMSKEIFEPNIQNYLIQTSIKKQNNKFKISNKPKQEKAQNKNIKNRAKTKKTKNKKLLKQLYTRREKTMTKEHNFDQTGQQKP